MWLEYARSHVYRDASDFYLTRLHIWTDYLLPTLAPRPPFPWGCQLLHYCLTTSVVMQSPGSLPAKPRAGEVQSSLHPFWSRTSLKQNLGKGLNIYTNQMQLSFSLLVAQLFHDAQLRIGSYCLTSKKWRCYTHPKHLFISKSNHWILAHVLYRKELNVHTARYWNGRERYFAKEPGTT